MSSNPGRRIGKEEDSFCEKMKEMAEIIKDTAGLLNTLKQEDLSKDCRKECSRLQSHVTSFLPTIATLLPQPPPPRPPPSKPRSTPNTLPVTSPHLSTTSPLPSTNSTTRTSLRSPTRSPKKAPPPPIPKTQPQHDDNIINNEDDYQLGGYVVHNSSEEDEESDYPEDVYPTVTAAGENNRQREIKYLPVVHPPNSSGSSSDSSFEIEDYSEEEKEDDSNIQCPSPLPPPFRDPSPFHIPKTSGEKTLPGLVLRQTSTWTSKDDRSDKSKSQFYTPTPIESNEDDYEDVDDEETYESILNDDTKNLRAEKRTDLVTPSGGLITSAEILTAHADYSGWLWRKDGFIIKSFVRFWALIYRCNLYLYNEPRDKKELDYIKLSEVRLRRHRKNEGFLLDLMDSNTTGKSKVIQYIFETRNEEQAATWIDHLKMAIAKGIEEREMASSMLTQPVVVTTSGLDTRRETRIKSERPLSSEAKTTVKARRARSDLSGSRKHHVPPGLPEPVTSLPIPRVRKETKATLGNGPRNNEMANELSAILSKRKNTID